MLNKVKKSVINYFKDYYKALIFFVVFFIIITYPVPYYVFTSGGITDLSKKFFIEESYNQKGSYNLSYVNQIEGNVLTYLASSIVPGWDAVKVENYQISSRESLEELSIRDHLSLSHANQIAVLLAYSKAGKEIKINNKSVYIYATYDFLESDKDIKIGDILLSVDGNSMDNLSIIKDIIQKKEVGDTVLLEFKGKDNTYKTNVIIKDISGVKALGVSLLTIYDFEVNPKILFRFDNTESGPSAGFMTTLAIYDSLIPDDLTNGLKIAGTGTIEDDGSVGEIGGIKYKLAGAESDHADIFFAPTGENYKEAIELKKKKNYKIKVVEVKTLDDAINYLRGLNNN